MVVPQGRPRCAHREEAAAAAKGGAPREVSETARGPPGCSRTGRAWAPLGRAPGDGARGAWGAGSLSFAGHRTERAAVEGPAPGPQAEGAGC